MRHEHQRESNGEAPTKTVTRSSFVFFFLFWFLPLLAVTVMDIVNVAEVPCFVFVYIMHLYEVDATTSYIPSPYNEIESRLYKSEEDATEGGKVALQQHQCNQEDETTKAMVHITKTLGVWDAKQKHITLLETAWGLGCKMKVSMIYDQARGYSLGQGVKDPIIIMERGEKTSDSIRITTVA